MALYFRKVQARICLASLLVLAVTPSLAQDDSANTTSVADGIAPVDAAPAASAATGRTVYKSLDSKGMVTFTDTPPVGRPSEAIVVQSANTMPIGVSGGDGVVSKEKKEQVNYTVTITSPTNDQFFGQEVDSVILNAELVPELRDGSTFQLYYDGKPVGGGGMSYTVTDLYRGTHTVEAKVFDNKKKLLKAAEKVQFHVRRITQLLPKQADNKPKEIKTTPPGSINGSGPMGGAAGTNGAGGPVGGRSTGAIGAPGGGLGAK